MTKKRKVSEPDLPEIHKCPRCGANVLLGDRVCSRCGYDVQNMRDRLRHQPPMVISLGSFFIGVLIAAAATGMENPWQFLALLIGFGFVVGGGLYYAADLLYFSSSKRRRK